MAERQNLLAPDWLSAPFLHLVGFLKSFVQNFLTQRSLQILTFKPTYCVEMHGNQARAGREGKKGEPKASHTDSMRLFVLKAKTLERLGAFVRLKKFLVVIKFLDLCLFTTASYKPKVLQAKENSKEIPQRDR